MQSFFCKGFRQKTDAEIIFYHRKDLICGCCLHVRGQCQTVFQKQAVVKLIGFCIFSQAYQWELNQVAEKMCIRDRKFGAKNIFDYIELNKEIGIYEIATPENWYGKTILEKSVRSNYNVTILATKKEERIYPLMEPEHVFVPDESLLVMGSAEAVHKLTR